MTYRDTYFFDLAREAGFDVTDPHDWVEMSIFAKEMLIEESEED